MGLCRESGVEDNTWNHHLDKMRQKKWFKPYSFPIHPPYQARSAEDDSEDGRQKHPKKKTWNNFKAELGFAN